jgi:predicted XRE-type DNA-binding protein
MNNDIEHGRLGQSFDVFLAEQGTRESTTETAIKRVIAFQLAEAMADGQISKAELARRLETSRSQVDRLLDPDNDGVTLGALSRAAHAVGRSLRLELA